MLKNSEKGYALISKDLQAISFEHISLDICEKYCSRDEVIIERIPKKCGFNISITFFPINKYNLFRFKQ